MYQNSDFPLVTVILPVRNEASCLRASLDSVLRQDYPQERMEILIADGMSTDGTRAIIREYQNRYDNVHLLDNPGKIVPTGMNIALLQAKGEFIVRVDGHTIVAPDYVRMCLDTFFRTKADNVGGCMTTTGSTKFGQAIAVATSTSFGIGNSRFHYAQGEEEVDSVYMGAWPKATFRKVGLFDEELVRDQDDEFNYRTRSRQGKIILNPLIRSTYTVRNSPKALWKQYFQYGFYKVRVLQKHPRQMSLRQFIPPLFVLSLIMAFICSLIFSWGWIMLTAVAGIYLLTNLSASLIISLSKGMRFFPYLPLAYAILHLSYGLGFLAGLIGFWNRWSDREGKVPKFQAMDVD